MKKIFICAILFTKCLMADAVTFEQSKWTELMYSKIPTNKVEYGEKSIKVIVDSSASPLVYKFDQPKDISEFEVNLSINGELNESDKKADFEEDSYFRLGMVVVGDNHLGVMGRMFAPKWVQQLFKLAPEGSGLDKIYFYNLSKDKNLVNKDRISPQSKYIYEKIIDAKTEKNEQKFNYKLDKSLKTAAIWISVDGDNTKSKFTTEIKSINLR